jgi:hypothetical protein
MKRTPIRKKHKGLHRGELTSAEKKAERDRVYERCGGQCELRNENGQPLDKNHWPGVLPKDGITPWDHWHLVHYHPKRPAFWSEAQGNILLGGCPACHLQAMHTRGMKPVLPERYNRA